VIPVGMIKDTYGNCIYPPAQLSINISASPEVLPAGGGNVTLTWSATDAIFAKLPAIGAGRSVGLTTTIRAIALL